jgi:hypothetical protein
MVIEAADAEFSFVVAPIVTDRPRQTVPAGE